MSNTASTRMAGAPTSAALQQFRDGFCGCLDGWGDALFELADAALCARSPVTSVPTLSLESVFRRSHSSLYKGLARGEIDTAALRCAPPNRPTAGPGSSWPPTPNSASPAASSTTTACPGNGHKHPRNSPARVRRGFPRVRAHLGTPTSAPKSKTP